MKRKLIILIALVTLTLVACPPRLKTTTTTILSAEEGAAYAAACFYLPDYDVSLSMMVNTHAGEAMFTINDFLTILMEGIK